jgi:hypothetical protein
MPRYLFHLSDNEHTFLDDTGKQLDDSEASHTHALRIMDQAGQALHGRGAPTGSPAPGLASSLFEWSG